MWIGGSAEGGKILIAHSMFVQILWPEFGIKINANYSIA